MEVVISLDVKNKMATISQFDRNSNQDQVCMRLVADTEVVESIVSLWTSNIFIYGCQSHFKNEVIPYDFPVISCRSTEESCKYYQVQPVSVVVCCCDYWQQYSVMQ